VVLKVNHALERHAGKIYTRAMFDVFGSDLFESGYYDVEEVQPGRRYLTRHVNSETREKWCKVVFEVTVDEGMEKFDYVCGNFEHTGMLCCHILKVQCAFHVWGIKSQRGLSCIYFLVDGSLAGFR
jgi:hypothetical protein